MIGSYNLTNDFLFRSVFGKQRNARILCSLINAVLEAKGYPPISGITVTNPTIEGEYLTDKSGILDVLAVDSEGRNYNIEIQVRRQSDYIQRTIFYLTRMVSRQLIEGERYAKLKPCIGIHILDYVMFPSFKDFHNQFLFRTGTPEEIILTHDLSLHYIELPKLNPGVHSFSNLEKWLYFIENVDKPEDAMIRKIRSEVPEMDKAAKEYAKLIANAKIMAAELQREKWAHDESSNREAAREDGHAEGKAEGLAEGLVEGELKKQREIAANLKAAGFSADKIAELTGMSSEAVALL